MTGQVTPAVALRGVSVRYDGTETWIGAQVDLDVHLGQVVLVLGPSGCGKSTLMLTLPALVPGSVDAQLRGRVEHDGADAASLDPGRLAARVGMVFQDPDAQVVTRTLLDEVCFGLENVCTPVELIEGLALDALATVGLATSRAEALRAPGTLSGGGRQRLALACALALAPQVLVLDEPTANLDPVASAELYATLATVRSPGRAIVLVEHELDEALPLADRVVVLDRAGAVVHDGTPEQVIGAHARELREDGIWLPTAVEVALALGLDEDGQLPLPLTTVELCDRVDAARPPVELRDRLGPVTARTDGPADDAPGGPGPEPAVELSGVRVVLGGRPVLHGIDLAVPRGELLAIAGVNGAGKSTLTRAVAGLVPLAGGQVRLAGRPLARMDARSVGDVVGYVFQNPEHQFVTHTVADELGYGLRVRRRDEEQVAAAVDRMLDRFDLARYRGTNPFLLSHGEKRRLSVATALITEPQVLVLDEPTFGQDRARASEIMDLVCALNRTGITVLLVTHDLQLIADHAHRVALLADGHLLEVGRTAQVLCHDDVVERAGLRVPPVHRIARALAGGDRPGWAGVYRTGQIQAVLG